MPSTFRIPKAELRGPVAAAMKAWSKRAYGDVPDVGYVLWHHKPVMRAWLAFERKVAKWDRLDPDLAMLAQIASAARIGCSWCLDYGYFLAHSQGLDDAKVSQIPVWRTATGFTELEREVLAYAEAMTATPPEVTDGEVQSLIAQLGIPAVVELTELIAVENMRSRFNTAAGLRSQGFSDVCAVPLAQPASAVPGSGA